MKWAEGLGEGCVEVARGIGVIGFRNIDSCRGFTIMNSFIDFMFFHIFSFCHTFAAGNSFSL